MKRPIETLRLSKLLPAIREVFDKVPDNRHDDAIAFSYPTSDVLMSGLAMMTVQDPSMLEFQRRLNQNTRSNNLKTLFCVDEIPATSQFRRILDPLNPSLIQEAFTPCLKRLQKTRLWSDYRVLDGRYAVLIDGSEFFRSEKCGCRNCREYKHRDGRIEYAHQVLVATLAHPTAKQPLPLLLEEISREDGVRKKDCEFNAALRLIPKLSRQHSRLDMVYVADGLFSKAPVVKLIKDEGASFILVAKPADHTNLEENLRGLRHCNGVNTLNIKLGKGRKGVYEWACNLELNGSTDEKVNWFSFVETTSAGKVVYRNSWITDLKPTKENIEELVEVGRHRWQIENQAFDVLKNHGYHLEHNFGHGENHLAFNFVILNLLAYMLHQLVKLSDSLFQAAMETSGTKHGLWGEIRVLLNYFVWNSWETHY